MPKPKPKPKRGPNWPAIEAQYLRGGISYRDLAVEHKVPESTLTRHAVEGHWKERRDEVVRTVDRALPGRVADAVLDVAVDAIAAQRADLETFRGVMASVLRNISHDPDELRALAAWIKTYREYQPALRLVEGQPFAVTAPQAPKGGPADAQSPGGPSRFVVVDPGGAPEPTPEPGGDDG